MSISAAGDFAHPQRVGDVLVNALVAVERIVLEHHAHAAKARRQVGDVLAVDQDAAAGRLLKAGKHAAGGRLARAGRPEQHDELAGIEFEVEPVQRGGAVREDLGYAVEDYSHR